jgi:hypothetical protein
MEPVATGESLDNMEELVQAPQELPTAPAVVPVNDSFIV